MKEQSYWQYHKAYMKKRFKEINDWKGIILVFTIFAGVLAFCAFASATSFGYSYTEKIVTQSLTANDCGSNVAFGIFSNGTLRCIEVEGGTPYDDSWIGEEFNLYVLISTLIDRVGNWSAEKINYYTKTEVNEINSSMNNYVLYVNSTNGAGSGGTPFYPLTYNPTIKRQLNPLSTSDNITYSATDLKFDLVEGTMYYLQCDIIYTGQAATTGQRIILSNNGSYSNPKVVYDTWSSNTANVGLSATTFGTVLVGTGSGGTVIKPNFIAADWNQTTNGTLSLSIASEIFGSLTQIERGSVCYLYNVGDLQQFTTPNPLTSTPAIKRQSTNIVTTSNSVWSGTDFLFNVDATKKYNLQCDLLYTGQAAGTGQVLNITTNITYSNAVIIYDTWSSATAPVGLSATAFNTALVGTGSGAALIKPNGLYIDFTTVTGGYINLTLRSEVSGSATTLINGSVCKLYDLT